MCGRYVTPKQGAIEREWDLPAGSNPLDQTFNTAPTLPVPILVRDDEGALQLRVGRWGLVPHWWTQPKPPRFCFNARLEEAATKPIWRDALRDARCLVPAEGWYEWQALQRVDEQTGEVLEQRKQPHFIALPDRGVFAFAGLWARRDDAISCAILTKSATGAPAQIHDRMPVVLRRDAESGWLDPRLRQPAALNQVIAGGARDDFVHHPVSAAVNSSRNEGPQLAEPQ